MSEFSVRTIPIADLRDHPRNSNRHGEHQLAVLEARFRALGWYKNVVVAEWEGTTTLLAGHGVTRGAERAGETVAPCHVRPIDPLSAEALDILEGDNTVADLAEPDLRERLRNLVELDVAGRLGNVGYDDGALDRLKAELAAEQPTPPVEDPGPSEPPTEPVSKLGDVWLCGEHRVVCGDCTEVGTWEALGVASFDLCLTDPPYGVGWKYESTDDTPENLERLVEAFLPIARAMARVVLLTPGNSNQGKYPAANWVLAWFCPAGVGRGPWGFTCWQPLLAYGRDPYLARGMGSRPDALVLQEGASSDDHPCAKPIGVWSWVLERGTTQKGQSVVDPFLGSGTTLIAAEQLGRVCYGIEIEPRYVDVAVRRWQQATGQTAILESTGEPFPVVE